MRAAAQRRAVQCENQRLGRIEALDADHLILAQVERILDDEPGEPLDARVDHRAVIAAPVRSRTASTKRPAPKRTGSSAGKPVSSSASATAFLAASSSRSRVLSAMHTTFAGRTGSDI